MGAWSRGIRRRGLILTGLACLSFWGKMPPAQAGDFQVWTELKYSHTFKPSHFTLRWASENRFRDTATEHFTFNTTLGFDYAFLNWFSLGPYYRYEKKRGNPGENRPFVEVVFKTPWKALRIQDRQRYEIRIFPDDTRFRFRNRIKLSHYFGERPVSYTPFVQDEIFVEQGHGFNENRLDVGNSFGVWQDRLSFTLYYRWQRKESGGSWENNHILGTALGVHY